jgi:hypothetical protein
MGKPLTAAEFSKQRAALNNELFDARVHSDILKALGEAWQEYRHEMSYSIALSSGRSKPATSGHFKTSQSEVRDS